MPAARRGLPLELQAPAGARAFIRRAPQPKAARALVPDRSVGAAEPGAHTGWADSSDLPTNLET
jgi:hypothetical protein